MQATNGNIGADTREIYEMLGNARYRLIESESIRNVCNFPYYRTRIENYMDRLFHSPYIAVHTRNGDGLIEIICRVFWNDPTGAGEILHTAENLIDGVDANMVPGEELWVDGIWRGYDYNGPIIEEFRRNELDSVTPEYYPNYPLEPRYVNQTIQQSTKDILIENIDYIKNYYHKYIEYMDKYFQIWLNRNRGEIDNDLRLMDELLEIIRRCRVNSN